MALMRNVVDMKRLPSCLATPFWKSQASWSRSQPHSIADLRRRTTKNTNCVFQLVTAKGLGTSNKCGVTHNKNSVLEDLVMSQLVFCSIKGVLWYYSPYDRLATNHLWQIVIVLSVRENKRHTGLLVFLFTDNCFEIKQCLHDKM